MARTLCENGVPNTQWQWLIVDDEMNIYGTNDPKVAEEAAVNSEHDGSRVIHIATCVIMESETTYNIPEQPFYTF